MIDRYTTERHDFDIQIADLRRELMKLQEQQTRVDNYSTRHLKQALQEKIDSIVLLHDLVAAKDRDIYIMGQEQAAREIQQMEYGQHIAYAKIASTYKSSSFDELLLASSLEAADRDLSLIGNDIDARQVLLNLKKYFIAQNCLNQKYDSLKIQLATSELNNITITEKSDLVNQLKSRISNYRFRSEGLKTTIDRIIQKDRVFIGDSDHSTKAKIQSIMNDIGSYIHDYRFNFIDYPYLGAIILEIIKRKQIDVNADISDIRAKL